MGDCISRQRPREQPAATPAGSAVSSRKAESSTTTTKWTVAVDTSVPNQPSATLSLSVNGGNLQQLKTKGVCYSPCPLNGSNAYGSIGDWFWDSYYAGPGRTNPITGWEALWQRDLPNIRAIGANTIRVYCMLSRQLTSNGGFPSPWNSGQLFTHTSFLDMCWNGGTDPLYVLVGIPMPQVMFWKSDYDNAVKNHPEEIKFWENVFSETVTQVGSHPAVLGFVIQNELDSEVVTWPSGDNIPAVEFWWSQVEKFANIAKTIAPDKLVGMADHDDPNIAGKAAAYMAKCPSVDYWGVNTYQMSSFDSIFNGIPGEPGYAGLTGTALKPVILTEYGFPSTSRHDANNPLTIYSNQTTQENVATRMKDMLPKAFQQQLCLGVYYFEYSDEWWNQDGSPNIYTWCGGNYVKDSVPNHYWDQEGFGLYSIQRGGNPPLANNAAIWDRANNCPAQPIDVHIARQPVILAVTNAYAN